MSTVRASIHGKMYTIDLEPFHALCDDPKRNAPRIHLANGLHNTQKSLSYLIHEVLHACQWSATEEKVDQTARDIAKILWKTGWRRK